MKKNVFLTLIAVCLVSFASAQITTGEPVSRIIKNGNRPTQGTWGLFIGPSVTEMVDWVDNWSTKDNNNYWMGIPLVNVKYYASSRLELRLGLQFYSKGENTTMKNDEVIENGTVTQEKSNGRISNGESYNRITPGIAYHFSPHNLVDVYVGATLPIGINTYTVKERNESVVNSETLKTMNNVSRNVFTIGLGAFVGLQFFVADLPLAFGLEYGFTGLAKFGGNYKHKTQTSGDEEPQVYYTSSESSPKFDYLSTSKGLFGGDARITISYFFNGKKK